MKLEIKKVLQLITLIVIVFGLSISLQSILAQTWIGPTETPPAGNVDEVINSSGIEQSKAGKL